VQEQKKKMITKKLQTKRNQNLSSRKDLNSAGAAFGNRMT